MFTIWYHHINMNTGSKTEQASSELQLNSPPHWVAKWGFFFFFTFKGQGSLLTFAIFTEYIQLENSGLDAGESTGGPQVLVSRRQKPQL